MPTLRALACITVDLGGHGDTPSLQNHVMFKTNAKNVFGLITTLDLPPAVVAGNSLGCRVTSDVAVRVPQHFCSHVLVDGCYLSLIRYKKQYAALCASAIPKRYPAIAKHMFASIFGPFFDAAKIAATTDRTFRIKPNFGMALLTDIGRHDLDKMYQLLTTVSAPVLAVQSTHISEGAS